MPEGLEDVSLEGSANGVSWHVQAKSRGEASGLFPVHESVDHILDSWEKHIARGEADSRLVVVFERGVKGETLPGGLATSAPTLAESLQDGSRLRGSLRDKCGRRGMSDTDVDRLLSSVVVVGVMWDEVTNETAACVGAVADLPPSSRLMVAYLLVGIVARASAENASRERGTGDVFTRPRLSVRYKVSRPRSTSSRLRPRSVTECASPSSTAPRGRRTATGSMRAQPLSPSMSRRVSSSGAQTLSSRPCSDWTSGSRS